MASEAAVDLRVERRPKLSESVVAAIACPDPVRRIRARPETADREPIDRSIRRQPDGDPRGDRDAGGRRAGGGKAGCGCVRAWTIPPGPSARSATNMGNKISHALNVLEVRMGIEIESAGLAALRRNSAQQALIQEAFFEFERLLELRQATGKADFAFHRAIAAATNNPFYVEVLDALGSRTIPCDVISPWGTESVLTRRLPGRAAARTPRYSERNLCGRSGFGACCHARTPVGQPAALPLAPHRPAGRIHAGSRQAPSILESPTGKNVHDSKPYRIHLALCHRSCRSGGHVGGRAAGTIST